MANHRATLGRRRFLATSFAVLLGTPIVQACAPAVTPTATSAQAPQQAPSPTTAAVAPSPTAPPTPTSAPKPTAAPATAKKQIRFSSYTWSGYEDAMKKVLATWQQENPNVELKTEFVGEDYWTKLQTQIAAGTPPDAGISDYARVVSYAKAGSLLALDDFIDGDKVSLEQYLPDAVAQYRWQQGMFDTGGKGGKVYGLPSDAQGFIFAYNKKMFDEAGVKYPTDDWTWDDLVAAAKQITKPDQNKWGCYAPNLPTLFRGDFVFSAGGDLATADYKKSALDRPETIEAYKWVWDLIYTYKVAPRPLPSEPANPFASGRVAMYVDGVWWVADFLQIKDFEWDLAMLPKHPKTGKRTTSLESDGWWAFKATKDPDLAWSLVKFLASPESQRKFGELEFVVPSSIPEVAKEWYAKKPPASRSKALDNLVQDSRKVAITFYENAKMQQAVTPVLQKAFFDGQDIVPLMKEAARIMNEELGKAWQRFGS
jgi:multiple sugar transport system substrate-binding protein